MNQQQKWMSHALQLARQAADAGEVPVAALLVQDDKLIASAVNSPIGDHDASAHAEINCLRAAGQQLKNYRLPGSTLYVTLEPCSMCAAALMHARVQTLVFGAYDKRAGAVGSQLNLLDAPFFNHRIEVQGGVLENECGRLLRDFFTTRRG